MSKVIASASELIGNTPLVSLRRTAEANGVSANLFGKLEGANLTGSVKDRIALSMVEAAEKQGKLIPGKSVIIEPTSGNTGIGLSAVGVNKGYKVIIVMPETFSVERRKLIAAYGAEIVLSDGKAGMKGAIAKASELAEQTPNSFIPSQFDNPANFDIHYATTGPEIFDALDGKVDVLVSGVGTGGTVSGAGKYLKEKNPATKIIAVEAAASPVLSGGQPGPHAIQGISPGFEAGNFKREFVDEIIQVSNEDALSLGKRFASTENILVGISSGAAVFAGIEVGKRDEFKGKNIVIILPDNGDRYLSTKLFENEE